MEFREANRILQSVRTAMAADGVKLPSTIETDGIMLMLGKLDADKYLAAKHISPRSARPAARDSAVFFRALCAAKDGLPAPVTYVSLMKLHKTLYGDIDENAGKPRSGVAETNGNAHTDPKYISGSLKAIIAKMNAITASPTISKDDFAAYLTHYMRELIILHPFDRGSTFTLRMFMMLFCKQKGFSLSFNRIAPGSIRAAEETVFLTDDITPMYKSFINCLSYERTTIAPPKSTRSKRDISQRAKRPPASIEQNTSSNDEITAVKLKAAAQDGGKVEIDDAKLKRIIKIQQKISKLNEQLATELSSDGLGTDDD